MEELGYIYKAFQTWDKICHARGYQSLHMVILDPERVLDPFPWPVPSFDEFFTWCLRQPGFSLPYMQLEGLARGPHVEQFGSATDNAPVERPAIQAIEGVDIPMLTVFAHSDKFEKEYNPSYGVDARLEDNLGITEMRTVIAQYQQFLEHHIDAPLVHLNLLVYFHVTSPSEKLLLKYLSRYQTPTRRIVVTIFSMRKDLQWFMLDHQLVLHHKVLSSVEIERELTSQGGIAVRLPQIRTTDPVARILGLCPGTVVRIDVPLDSLQDPIYRIVVEGNEQTFEDETEEEDNDESQ